MWDCKGCQSLPQPIIKYCSSTHMEASREITTAFWITNTLYTSHTHYHCDARRKVNSKSRQKDRRWQHVLWMFGSQHCSYPTDLLFFWCPSNRASEIWGLLWPVQYNCDIPIRIATAYIYTFHAHFITVKLLANTHNTKTNTRWFKYDRDYLCVNKSQFVPVIFEPPCIRGLNFFII
jgi:hypothetical protein